jgi:hypothetical protein
MTFWEKQFVAISKSTVKRRAADPYCICLNADSLELLDLGPNLFRYMNPGLDQDDNLLKWTLILKKSYENIIKNSLSSIWSLSLKNNFDS